VFLNIGPDAADVTCDPDCFSQMGFTATDNLVATDLWDDNSGPIKISGANYTVNLPGAGGSAHYTITKSA
jgi:hypothetical protein